MNSQPIQEDSFPSDTDFDEEADSESSTDVDAKVAEEEIFDAEFLKCYSALKRKDERIYDKDVIFFNKEDDESETNEDSDGSKDNQQKQSPSTSRLSKRASDKPRMTLLDHQLKFGLDEFEDLEGQKHKINLNEPVSKSFYERELEEIKKNIAQVTADADDSDEELFVAKNPNSETSEQKVKTKKINSILQKIEEDDDNENFKHLKEIWSQPDKLTEEEKYLRDYILNKRYLPGNSNDSDDNGNPFFSKNIDELSDVEDEESTSKRSERVKHRSDEQDFDKISRIPRHSTKTIRDLVEKQSKKEKRLKKIEKEKKRKQALKGADYEDVVGDLATRFHYRETEPNDYGLSAEELLMATDEELEKWIKLTDAIKYKTPEEEARERSKYDTMRNDITLKKQIFKSLYGSPEPEDTDAPTQDQSASKPKKGRKRKRSKKTEASDDEGAQVANDKLPREESANQSRRKRKRKRGQKEKFSKTGVAPDRLLSYGISKTKLKRSQLL